MTGDLTAEASFTRIEEGVRRYWRRHEVPEAFHAARRGGNPYVICQEPLLAAGGSPTDQVRLLATTDLLARYHAMRGEAVQRWTGWLCHGLPVELAVERSLGPDVTGYDLAEFNAACHSLAVEGVQHGEALAERMAVWPGPGGAFLSLEPEAMGTVWGAVRRLWDDGRLRHEHRIASVCPRCATPLSSAEAARRAIEVDRRAIRVQIPWDGEPGAYFLAWTPSPWMLVGMVSLAAHPRAEYALVQMPGEAGALGEAEAPEQDDRPPVQLLLAEAALRKSLPDGYRIVRQVSGRTLRGARYRPPFTFLPAGEGMGRLLLSEEVPLDRGTGLWPVTPTFDPLSLAMAQSHDLPVPQLLDDWGALDDTVAHWRGYSPLDAEPLLVEDLRDRGLIFDEQRRLQPQALCPHCDSPLLPLARSVWLAETGSGPWIVSRDRPWGTALPIWSCEGCGQELCVAGLDDLARRTGLTPSQIDPHRPAVDRLVFPCEDCGGVMRRVGPVVDVAFEAAVLGQPVRAPDEPASLAIGLGDRHLGWLGDLAEVTALLRGAIAWEQALALPRGEPETAWELERILSADAVRWAAYAGTTPTRAEAEFLRPLWRWVVSLPGSLRVESPGQGREADLLDRWLAARLSQAIEAVTQALETQDPHQAAGDVAGLVSDIVDWYAAHRPGAGGATLQPLSRLLAPFAPHLAEAIHRRSGGRTLESVHLAAWPSPQPPEGARALLAQMARVRRLAELGQRARAQAGVEPDRPLARAVAGLLEGDRRELDALDPFAENLASALGVRQVEFAADAAARVEWRLSQRSGRLTERDVAPAEVESALTALEAEEARHMAWQLRDGLSVSLQVSGQSITLLPDEVSVSIQAHPGWAAAADAEHLVILDVG